VTARATWTIVQPGVGQFTAPGSLVPVARGEATLETSYGGYRHSGPTFLLDPSQTARYLYFGPFSVFETDAKTGIGGVVIQIMSGYRTGATCVTNAGGFCSIDRLLTYEEFTATASKPGYLTTTFNRTASPPLGTAIPFPSVLLQRN